MTRTNKLSTLLLLLMFVSVQGVYAQISLGDLENRDGLLYVSGSSQPYTGSVAQTGRMSGQVKEGLRVGEWVWTYEDGSPEFLAGYDDEGVLIRRANWHPNGVQESDLAYRNGQAHGPMEHRDINNVLRERHAYRNGQQHGTGEIFDHDGNLLIKTEYVDGERHGQRVWYYPDGSKRWETSWNAGERNGTWTQYTREGTVVMQTEWENGELADRLENPHNNH
jgi:antitoxin component YwqK of YwqJK toxin-antitoxin module